MRRRRLLTLFGTLLAGSGCQRLGEDTQTVTPVPSPGERRTATDTDVSAGLDVRNPTVQPGYVARNFPDSIAVYDDADQYLTVEVRTVDGTPPDRSAFRLGFDGTDYQPVERRTSEAMFRDGESGAGYADGGGVLVFGLPEAGDASGTKLTWPGGERRFTKEVEQRLAAPLPSFDVTLSGPDVATDGDPTIEFAVTNTGDVAGRYLLALNRAGPRVASVPVRRISGVLDAGKSRTVVHDARSPVPRTGDPNDVTYILDAPGERNDATHQIAPAAVKSETTTESEANRSVTTDVNTPRATETRS
ncbi:hypothetical protein [Haloarcula salina]|uniref:CARDB domain-containing protein n=1 Tax=Haloarcula salina TaxID=1429914 RepID=A0AA41G604_9EURY|nr:hypothetical protein [Haloarcula salina]MBV0900742.1 hypothetical protein [Haloarcula salina]